MKKLFNLYIFANFFNIYLFVAYFSENKKMTYTYISVCLYQYIYFQKQDYSLLVTAQAQCLYGLMYIYQSSVDTESLYTNHLLTLNKSKLIIRYLLSSCHIKLMFPDFPWCILLKHRIQYHWKLCNRSVIFMGVVSCPLHSY